MHDDTARTFRFNRPLGPFPQFAAHPRKTVRPPETVAPLSPHERTDTPKKALTGSEGNRAVVADAEQFLRHAKSGSSQPIGSADWLRRAGLNIRKASDAQHLEAVALAYAAYIRISVDPLRPAIMSELETLSGRKRSRTTQDLHLIVERFVSYGGETAAERLAARKLVSRDVRAILHLETAKVLPSRVQVLAATPGERLHAWARQNAAAKRVTGVGPSAIAQKRQAKNEARQRALTHEVTITTRRPDGTRKGRQRFQFAGVLKSDIAGLEARITHLARQSESKA